MNGVHKYMVGEGRPISPMANDPPMKINKKPIYGAKA